MGCKTIYLILFLILFSCGKNKKQAPFAGGTFSLSLKSSYIMSDPAEIDDYGTAQIMGQVYEGLVSFHPKDLTVQAQLAKSYEIKKGGLVYEFKLRDNVLFHDFGASDADRLLKVEDVIFSIERACRPNDKGNPSAAYSLVYRNKLKGADAYYSGKAKSISGLSSKGNTVILELEHADFNFLEKMSQACTVILSKKLSGDLKQAIGTGPFMLTEEYNTPQNLKLLKNPDYYMYDEQGFALPYLDTLEFNFETRKLEELEQFENRKLDVLFGLPASRITEMLQGRYKDFNSVPPLLRLHSSAILRTEFYFFDMTDPRFKDPRVRQAFNLAVDKNKIGQNVLRLQYSELGNYGLVPPLKNNLRGYDFEKVKAVSYQYDPEKAKRLLAEAGFPGGKGFGPVILRFNIADVHSAVADVFSQQIKMNLGITVNIDGSSYESLSSDQETGAGDIFRTAWVADYPDPESFLQKFAGKFVPDDPNKRSNLNNARYKNPAYDEYYEKALLSTKIQERRKYFSLAEVELMKDPPIIPLWYSGEFCVIYENVRNFHFNSLNLFDFRKVYIKEWSKEEYLNKRKS